MADRKFEFSNVASNYENMKKILGDSSVSDSIAGILHNIDEDMKEHVDVVDMAIYGDLGKQMLLNWENTSSTFGSFINNFDNWNKAVAMASGNYAEFVNKVQGLRDTNPLGMTSGGITEAYTNTGYYSSFDEALIDTAAAHVGSFVAYNGIGYFDTGSVALEEQRKTAAIWSFGLNLVADVLSVVGIGKYVKAAGGVAGIGSKISGVFAQSGDDLVTGGAKALASTSGKAAGEVTETVFKATANVGDDGVIKAGKYAGKTLKDIFRSGDIPGNIESNQKVVQELIDDGIINNQDDLLRLFGGNAGAAKSGLTSKVYNSYIKGFKQAATGANVTTPTVGNTGTDLSKALADGDLNYLLDHGYTLSADGKLYPPSVLNGAAPTPGNSALAEGYQIVDDLTKGSIDDMINKGYTLTSDGWVKPASTLGAPSSAKTSAFAQLTDEQFEALAKGTLNNAGASGATANVASDSSKGVMQFINKFKTGATSGLNTVKGKLSGVSDEIIIKTFNISDDSLASLARHGLTVKDYAAYTMKNGISNFGTSVSNGLGSAKTWLTSNLPTIPEGYYSQVTSQASHLLSSPGTKTVISGYVPNFIEDAMLSDEAMASTSYTDSVYVRGTE